MSDFADMFPGYESRWINTSSGRIFARVGGDPGSGLGAERGFLRCVVEIHVTLLVVIASEAKQSRVTKKDWIASSLRSSQ